MSDVQTCNVLVTTALTSRYGLFASDEWTNLHALQEMLRLDRLVSP